MFALSRLWSRRPRRIYLDYAAATPLAPSVRRVLLETAGRVYGNPSAIHAEGVAARAVVEAARTSLARTFGVRPSGVTFTGSGTESNNLAILGAVYARHAAGVPFADMEIVSTAIEHPSIMQTLAHLMTLGVTVHTVPVLESGIIEQAAVKECLSPQTVLVTFAYANSEVGVVQPVSALVRLVRTYERDTGTRILVHIDAAQAPLWLSCRLDQLQADVMTLDAGKCNGPKGVGAVVVRHGVALEPVSYGGPQEAGLRPATENVPGIAAAAEAFTLAQAGYVERSLDVTQLRDQCITDLEQLPGVVLNGDRVRRLANNINISIPGLDTEFAAVVLDEAGIACSTKSACSGAGGGQSVVVAAMTGDTARAQSTLRFTLSPHTTTRELDTLVGVLQAHIARMSAFLETIQ